MLPTVLKEATVTLRSFKQCFNHYESTYLTASQAAAYDPFLPSMLCSQDVGQGVCSGDSGGPVTLPMGPGDSRPVQVGIVSWVAANLTHVRGCPLQAVKSPVRAAPPCVRLLLHLPMGASRSRTCVLRVRVCLSVCQCVCACRRFFATRASQLTQA